MSFAVHDLQHRQVPDQALFFFCPLALIAPFVISGFPCPWEVLFLAVLDSAAGGFCGFFLLLIPALLSRDGSGVGGGDIKLAGLLGYAYGLQKITWILLAASAAAAVAAVTLTHKGRLKKMIPMALPFVPFFAMGCMAVTAASIF